MAQYTVTYAVDARFTAYVEASSLEEAKEAAKLKWWDAAIGDLEIVGSKLGSVQDEHDNFLYEA